MAQLELSFFTGHKPETADILVSSLSDIGFTGFMQEDEVLKAYIEKENYKADELTEMLLQYPIFNEVTYTHAELEDKNWNEEWEKSYDPVYVTDSCIILAPFHTINTSNIKYPIYISPKMAFGTGHHATTVLMMQAMLNMEMKDKKLADIGCGSGVLAILAEKMGTGTIFAIDIDEWSVNNTLENIGLNDCKQVIVKQGDVTTLNITTFHTILANINRNVLLADMRKFAEILEDNGTLLVSGFFRSDIPMLEKEALTYGFCKSNSSYKEEWACLQFKKVAK